ncbi:ABC transporter ATP-binding protein [Pseudolabrys sp.]|uniref:ABC transporter ATP-binding protein n=1 Tax=Pseudolabrys sp. TaxID=1960880 RepID=UPI0039C8C8A3
MDDAGAGRAFVDIAGVTLRYGAGPETQALADLTMQVKQGEFAAVVGPSGCGKSSLMKLVTGLLPPTGGRVDVAAKNVNGPLKIVGMAFQNSTLLPWRNILDNVMLPLEIVQPHRERLRGNRAEYEKRARGLLESVGLGGLEKQQPWMLSGGMQQRANLCRSLVHSPQLLMLDEPFGALDAFTREELWAILQELWLQQRFTCILVTHDLREAAYLADVIFVMSARPGRIIATHRVDLPRPRTVDTTFDPAFVDLVHRIRGQIAEARGGKATASTRGAG